MKRILNTAANVQWQGQVDSSTFSSINEPGAVLLLCPLEPGEDNLRPLIIPLSDFVMQLWGALLLGRERESARGSELEAAVAV